MALARPRPSAECVKYSPPTAWPATVEFEILLYLSVKDLSSACGVSRAWLTAIDDITLCKIMLNYNKKDAEEEQNAEEKEDAEEEKDKDTPDNRLLGCLLEAIKSQHIQSVHLLIALGVDVNKHYRGRFDIACSTDVKKYCWNERTYPALGGYFKNPTPLVIASTVSSGQKGAKIVQLLLHHDADILERSGLHEPCFEKAELYYVYRNEKGQREKVCDPYYRPS